MADVGKAVISTIALRSPESNLVKLAWFVEYTAAQIAHAGRLTLSMAQISDAVDDHLFEEGESSRMVIIGQAFAAGRLVDLRVRSFGFERVRDTLEAMTLSVLYSMVAFEVIRNGYVLRGNEFHRTANLLQSA